MVLCSIWFSVLCVPSLLWHCWLGHLTYKNPSSYDLYCVGGTLSLTQSSKCRRTACIPPHKTTKAVYKKSWPDFPAYVTQPYKQWDEYYFRCFTPRIELTTDWIETWVFASFMNEWKCNDFKKTDLEPALSNTPCKLVQPLSRMKTLNGPLFFIFVACS